MIKLIAEIYNKISKDGRNLSDRLEDKLTGDVFGTLRYMSFNRGLKVIFTNGIYPKSTAEVIGKIDEEEWDVWFWRRSQMDDETIDLTSRIYKFFCNSFIFTSIFAILLE